ASVWNGHAMPQAGGTQAFAGKQTVGDQRPRQAVQTLEQEACFFKSTFLAGGINAHEHLIGRQDGGEAVHGSFWARLCTAWNKRSQLAPQSRFGLAAPPVKKPPHRAVGEAAGLPARPSH